MLGAAISLVGAGRPSFWYDEAATISASYSRSLGELWQMLGHVDAVHGLYYVLMHGWFQLAPPTEFWSRVPSGLAVGGAAAGLVLLGTRLSSRTVGVVAGVMCAILPRATWAGIEARPYALSMMAAVWLGVLLVWATRRKGVWPWVFYGALLGVSILLDVYLALMFFVHAIFVVAFRRAAVAAFAVTSVVVLAAAVPFVALVASQAHQVSWLTPIGWRTFEDVAVQQYFDRNPSFALLAGLVVAVAAVVALFGVVAAHNHLLVQRGPYAKYGMDYSQVADLISARASAGDCLLVNDTVTFHPAPMRPLMAARPDAYRELVDVSLWQRAIDRDDVFDTNLIPEASVGPLEHCTELWIITQAEPPMPFVVTPAFPVVQQLGFQLLDRWQFSLVQVIKAQR